MNFKDSVNFYLKEQFRTVNDETNEKEEKATASCKCGGKCKKCKRASKSTETKGGDDDDDGYRLK